MVRVSSQGFQHIPYNDLEALEAMLNSDRNIVASWLSRPRCT